MVLDAVTNRSVAWRLLRELAAGGITLSPPAADDAVVAAALSSGLSHMPTTRDVAGGTLPGTGLLRVPGKLKRDGRTSPHQLARVVTGADVSPRQAQEQMAELLSRWLPDTDGAIEAPTGTGKSLAALAVALDHLEADPAHRVVIATHTRQLQAQLARDVDRLEQAVPGLLALTDVVKGATNRLSMRALVTALADTAHAASGPMAIVDVAAPCAAATRTSQALPNCSPRSCCVYTTPAPHYSNGPLEALTPQTCRCFSKNTYPTGTERS